MISVSPNSHLQHSPLLVDHDIIYWDLGDLPDIPVQDGDIQYPWKDSDRFDLLAFDNYRDPVLKWVILQANNIELEFLPIPQGTIIRIPSPDYVLNKLRRV